MFPLNSWLLRWAIPYITDAQRWTDVLHKTGCHWHFKSCLGRSFAPYHMTLMAGDVACYGGRKAESLLKESSISNIAAMRKLNDGGSWPLTGQSFDKIDKRWHSNYEIPGVTGLSRSCCCQNCREWLMLLVSMEGRMWQELGGGGLVGWKCSYWSAWTLHSSVLPMRCSFLLNTTHDLHKGHPSQHALAHFSSRHRRGRIFRCVCVNVHLFTCLCPPVNVLECV